MREEPKTSFAAENLVKPDEAPQVWQELKMLQSDIEDLTESQLVLLNRLAPVLQPEEPGEQPNCKDPQPQRVLLAEELHTLRYRVRDLNSAAIDALERLEI